MSRFTCSSLVIAIAVLALGSCLPGSPPSSAPGAASMGGHSPGLTEEQKRRIGMRIWQNECAGTIEGLTTWNAGENFPSLGIGHTLWFPAGHREPFTETFPEMVRFIEARGKPAPAWARPPAPSPWPDRATFQREINSPKMRELRAWLSNTIPEQTDFLIARQNAALPKILAAAPPNERARITRHFHALQATPEGQFALIDYVNFKGEGINPQERYQGVGWGLLQVLQEMRGEPTGQAAVAEFARASEHVLMRRIELSPLARGEQRWRQGWQNRVRAYRNPL